MLPATASQSAGGRSRCPGLLSHPNATGSTASFLEVVSLTRLRSGCKCSTLHIMSLPEGYDTPVGERGMTLSGGERQRISLARAFLKDAPILILDEPTSSVDLTTEAVIIEAMERLAQRRTTFMITHRVDTLKHCGLILRIDRGLSGQATLVTARNTTDIISS